MKKLFALCILFTINFTIIGYAIQIKSIYYTKPISFDLESKYFIDLSFRRFDSKVFYTQQLNNLQVNSYLHFHNLTHNNCIKSDLLYDISCLKQKLISNIYYNGYHRKFLIERKHLYFSKDTLDTRIKVNRNDKILFIGNSITEGSSYQINYLKSLLSKNSKDESIYLQPTFVISVISGEQAKEGLLRIDRLIDKENPAICVINYGTCEVTFQNINDYKDYIQKIIDKLKLANINVIIVSPPPCSKNNWQQSIKWPVERYLIGLPIIREYSYQVALKNGLLWIDIQNYCQTI